MQSRSRHLSLANQLFWPVPWVMSMPEFMLRALPQSRNAGLVVPVGGGVGLHSA